MRLRKTSTRLLAASLCLAVAVTCTGCGGSGGGSGVPQNPSSPSSSPSENGSGGWIDGTKPPETEEEALQNQVKKYSMTAANANASWKSVPGKLFEVFIDNNGRVYDGVWRTYEEARPRPNTKGIVWFTSIIDDSNEGTNCVWDSKTRTLSYVPTNVNDKSTYLQVDGYVYQAYVAKDGTLYNGDWVSTSQLKQDDKITTFTSFPYTPKYTSCDYVFDGHSLKYEPVRVSDPKYWVSGRKTDSGVEMICTARVDSEGRILYAGYDNVSRLPNPLPDDYCTFETCPEYLGDGCGCLFWDGHTLTHDGTRSQAGEINRKYNKTAVHHYDKR